MEADQLPEILSFVASYGYVALFLVLFLEELGVPLPLPGDVALLFAGYLVGRGVLRFDLAILTIVLAALLGASALYQLTRRYGRPMVIRYGRYIHLNAGRLEWLESRFRRFGLWAVLIARVTPGMRIYTSVLAGLGEVQYLRFSFALGTSSAVWAITLVFVGSKIGERWDELAVLFEHHVLLAVAIFLPLLVLGAVGFWLYRADWTGQLREGLAQSLVILRAPLHHKGRR